MFLDIIQRWVTEPPPDYLIEITESSLAAVSPSNPSEQRREVLPERGLQASPAAPNFLRPELYREVLPRLTGHTGGAKRNNLALIIPDYAVRMTVLEFEQFPQTADERMNLLRFRLRKSVPFPIEDAQLSYAIQSSQADRIEVLVVAVARPILEEYEGLFRDAGFRPGLVVPSAVAALRLCDRGESGLTLLAKAAGATLSVLLSGNGQVRVVRSLDLTGDEDEWQRPAAQAVLPLLQQTVAFAEDHIGQAAERLVLCGFGPETDELGQMAEREFGLPYSPARSKFGIASQENAGLLGLLEQYAA